MFSEKIHRVLFLFGVFSLGFGMMIGAVPTSVPQLILLGNWLIELKFLQKWKSIRTNKLFWILISLFLMYLLGTFYSSDFDAALNELRIKAPLLILPLVFFTTKPLSLKEFEAVLLCFLIGSIANTGWCLVYSFVMHHNEVGRNASRFMSHIRLGLYLNMAIATSFYFAVVKSGLYKKIFFVVLAVYFIIVMYVLGLASGLVNLFILSIVAVCVIVYQQKPLVKIVSFLLLALCTFFIVRYIYKVGQSQLKINNSENNILARKSLSGKPYTHFGFKGQIENGNYVFINIQLDELKKEWAKQFPKDSFCYYPNTHNINRYEVLIRYLASMGLNKDSVGVSRLSEEDKMNIQKNICNYRYSGWSFTEKRIYELVCEYDDFKNGRDINGHSLTMRFYFWHAAMKVIGEHPLFGVGSGDVQQALNKVYVNSHSPLEEEWYKRPHNQFLTIMVSFGLVGLLIFLISVFYPLMTLRKYLPILYWPFFVLVIVSFMLEDTLDTQAGLTFYAVFNVLFVSFAFFKKQLSEIKTTQTPGG